MSNLFKDHCLIVFEISAYLLADNRTQLAGHFFQSISRQPEVKYLPLRAHHTEFYKELESCNKTIVTGMSYYIKKHQKDRYTVVQRSTYFYVA